MSELNLNPRFDNPVDADRFLGYMRNHRPEALQGGLPMIRAYQEFFGEEYGRGAARSVSLEPYTSDHKFYDSGPISWQSDGDLICEMVNPGSETVRSLPVETIETEFEDVAHWDAVWDTVYQGSDYISDIAALVIDDCDVNTGGMDFNTFQYRVPYGRYSKGTDAFNLVDTWLLKDEYKRSPQFTRRYGPFAGKPLKDDAEVQVASLGILYGYHLNTVTFHGVRASNPKMMWDGLNTVLTTSYVTNNVMPGSAGTVTDHAKPYVINAATYTPATMYQSILQQVITRFAQVTDRGWALSMGDYALHMHPVHWYYLAREIAVNGIVGYQQDPNRAMDATSEFNRLMQSPSIPTPGYNIPVKLDSACAVTSTGNAVGSIYMLTYRANGENVLAQQYADWSKIQLPTSMGANPQIMTQDLLGGIVRVGQKWENDQCVQYYLEAIGRIVSRAQFLQTRYTNFSVPIPTDYKMESSAYGVDFYAQAMNGGSLPSGI